jgi:hypothetical protein
MPTNRRIESSRTSSSSDKRATEFTFGFHIHVPIPTALSSRATTRLILFAKRNPIDVVLLGDGSDSARKNVRNIASLFIIFNVLAGRVDKAAVFAEAALVLQIE